MREVIERQSQYCRGASFNSEPCFQRNMKKKDTKPEGNRQGREGPEKQHHEEWCNTRVVCPGEEKLQRTSEGLSQGKASRRGLWILLSSMLRTPFSSI